MYVFLPTLNTLTCEHRRFEHRTRHGSFRRHTGPSRKNASGHAASKAGPTNHVQGRSCAWRPHHSPLPRLNVDVVAIAPAASLLGNRLLHFLELTLQSCPPRAGARLSCTPSFPSISRCTEGSSGHSISLRCLKAEAQISSSDSSASPWPNGCSSSLLLPVTANGAWQVCVSTRRPSWRTVQSTSWVSASIF